MISGRRLLLTIVAAVGAIPLAALVGAGGGLSAAEAPAVPTAGADDEIEPDPHIRPEHAWRGEDYRFFENSLSASLTTLDGATLQLPRDALGKITMLHFWSTYGWEIPHLRVLYDLYHDRGLEIVGINVDRDRGEVEAVVRQQGLSWPQVFSGQGTEDPLLARLHLADKHVPGNGRRADRPRARRAEVPGALACLIGWDGRVVSINQRGGWASMHALDEAIRDQIEDGSELGERFSFYRSGEFLAVTPLLGVGRPDVKSAIPQASLEAIQARLRLPGWTAGSKAQKIQSFKEALAAGQSLEKSHPDDPSLPVVRGWMLVAAKWLAVTTGQQPFGSDAIAIANRLLASAATPAAKALADYVATSAQLAQRKPRTKGGRRMIEAYQARHAGSDVSWAADILAVMLTLEDAQDELRQPFVQQLRASYENRPSPAVRGFLRDFCNERLPEARNRPSFRIQLTRMDGRPLVLPDELLGKVVVLQFWSAAHPPKSFAENPDDHASLTYTGLATVPSDGVVVVGINLDRNRADAEAFLKKSRYPDWIHTFSGLGWDDPAARACDILWLPRAVVLNRYGEIAFVSQTTFGAHDREFVHRMAHLVAEPATRPANP